MNWLLFKNSLLVSGLATLLGVSFGFIAALWLAGLPARRRNFLMGVAIIALALPPFLVTNCWLDLLGYTGVWRRWLPLNIFSLGGAAWILALLLWPITLVTVWAAWQRLEPAQLESDMAVTGWALLRGLLIPLARNALALASVLTFVLAVNNFAIPAILQVKVAPAEMWVRFNTMFDTWGTLRLSWPLVLAPLLLLLLFARRPIPWPHLQPRVSPKLFRQQIGRGWFWCSGAGTLLLCLLAVGLPLLQLASVKRTWSELPGAIAAGRSAVWNSAWFAALSATVVAGVAVAVAAVKAEIRGRQLLDCGSPLPQSKTFGLRVSFFLWLAFLLPGVLLGLGLITVFNRPWSSWFYQSAGIVILAFVLRYLALGWTAVAHAVRGVDPDLTDAARVEGASRLQMLRHVYWPQIAPQAAAAWYIVFLLCLWDVESMILIVPPGGETLALRIFNLLHYGHNAQVNALCLTLLGVAVAPLVIWGGWSALRRRVSSVRCQASRVTCHVSRVRCHVSGVTCHALVPSLLCLVSCAPPPASNQAPLQSQLFSRVEIIGSRGVGLGQFNKPRSVAVDRQDNLYVVDMTGRVQKFSPDGTFLLSWQMPLTDLGKPKGMCCDREGNIVVLEPHYQRVNHFSPEGKLTAQWGQRGTNAGQFMLPRAVAVNSRGEIFVSEYATLERVQKFARAILINTPLQRGASADMGTSNRFGGLGDAQKTAEAVNGSQSGSITPLKRGVNEKAGQSGWLDTFGHAGTGPGEFNRPEGLCVDTQDHIYVADSCNHRIQVFSSDGRFLRAYGKAGSGKGELSYPYDICVDAAGRQYVCEFGNSRIQVFDANDQSIEIIGSPGAEPGRFSNPWGLALDSAGNLYVADAQNHRVQKLIRRS